MPRVKSTTTANLLDLAEVVTTTVNSALNSTKKDMWGFPYDRPLSNPYGQYLYDTFYGKGVQLEIILPPILYIILMFLSYFGNGMIVFSTIINKNLHGSYNILMCMGCIGDMMHQSCHWVYSVNMFSGNNFIPYNLCFYTQAFFQTGGTLSVLMTFFVGVDRLISVTLPTTYRQLNYWLYIGSMFLITAAFALYVLYLGWAHVHTEYGGEPVMCVIIDSMGGEAANTWFIMCVATNALDVLIYGAVWATLKLKTGTSDSMKKVFKSLLVIMCFVFFGWMLNAFVRSVLLVYFNIPIEEWFYYASYFGLCANIASTSNFAVLYIFSSEYRSTFQRLLGPIFPCMRPRDSEKKVFNTPSTITAMPSKQ
ncbi:unnamed protein product [Bursaphelenchus xylophilus]|uniref:(pine wood nematode) hypothetical protein n=1 Tax=Bursaphelenchus xylophilus TaxID=6326 RepID=A0A1I7RK34_BURXY|nr:unnamed protein product [Bursaphelenchus xylophilus]CAG9131539.1 unnamed protein product [Bursaphelenchus xylophilus]